MARVQYVDSKAKIFLILYPSFENSTTRIAILYKSQAKAQWGWNIFGVISELNFLGKKLELFYQKVCNDKFYLIENFRLRKYVLKL